MSKRDETPDKPVPVATQDEAGDEPFLKRWSRLKSEEGADAAEPADAIAGAAAEDGTLSETHTETLGDGEVPAIDPADLPDVESLGKNSDYTVFMQAGVPDALRTTALRKLFASNPGLAVLDGLNEYDEDYSKLGMVSEVVKTAYKVGRGFLEDEDLVEIDEAEVVDETEEIEETEEIGDGEDGGEPLAEPADPTVAEEGEPVAANDRTDRGDKTKS